MSSTVAPEDAAKHELTEWLQQDGLTVYWEKDNAFNYPTFRIENVRERPDLVIEGEDITVAVEMKDASSKSNVYDSLFQLHRYWRHYSTDAHQYVAEGRPIDIDGFVVGTQYSLSGHLYENDVETILPAENYGDGRKRAIRIGELPSCEYNMTEQFIRLLWRGAKRSDVSNTPAIGALLSTALEAELPAKPAVLWTLGGQQGWRVVQ